MSNYRYTCPCCGMTYHVTSTESRTPRKEVLARMVCQLCRDAIKYCRANCHYDGADWKPGLKKATLIESMITTACQHFSNEALERARRWNHQAAVKEFMVKFGQYRQEKPGWPPQEVLDLRIRLIAEEFTELLEAAGYGGNMWIARTDNKGELDTHEVFNWYHEPDDPSCDTKDFPKTIDGIIDLKYVLEGMLEGCGVQGQQVWDKVHAANMRKEGGATREDGKICKPEGWVGPDIERALREQGWEG